MSNYYTVWNDDKGESREFTSLEDARNLAKIWSSTVYYGDPIYIYLMKDLGNGESEIVKTIESY